MDKFLAPEIILRITKEFDESDQGAPRMWSVDNESLQKDFGHNLPETIILHLQEEVE